ncbi:MAG: penicillin-binding protein [Polyangiaceae bacterium]|nr:penicillin-binding protein [Polyangiaceae bacterium]
MNSLKGERGKGVRLRMGIVCGMMALGLGLIVSAASELMLVDGVRWREMAEQQRQRKLNIIPKRGTIYDRNGSALAISVEVPSVSLDAYELLHNVEPADVPAVAREAANRIASALSLNPADVEGKILQRRRFIWLKRRISSDEVLAMQRLSAPEPGGAPKLRGILIEPDPRRFYPRRELAGPMLGFVAPDGKGKDGVEYRLNADLEGSTDSLRGLRDRAGRLIFADGMSDDRALAGNHVYLSIDQRIQYVAERELANTARTFEARGGSVVVVRPKTGEILALASWPGYNPNDYRESGAETRRDRSTVDVFEPGSTMKIFTVAAALEGNAITPTQKLYCEKGSMRIDNITIRDTHPSEWLSIAQVLAQSSNICAAKIGLSLGSEKLYDALRSFGFGQETGIELAGESSGTLRPRGRPWVQVETASASFGQGIGITNLQMAMAASAIANGGLLMDPIIVQKVTTASGEVVREASPKVRRRVVSRRVAREMAELLVSVTEDSGTGLEAAIPGYQVAGKTATAQKTDPKTGQYSLDYYVGSFVGFVPAFDPDVVVSVMVDEPMLEHAGGAVAAPIFRRVSQAVLEWEGSTPKGTQTADLAALARTPDAANITYDLIHKAQGGKPAVQEVAATAVVPKGRVRVPDMTGWPMRRALVQAREIQVAPKVVGTGLIARQVPAPGEIVDVGASIVLYFEPAS